MQIFHQCGHNFVWNLDSFREDGVGDGFIISPVNIESHRIRDRYGDDLIKNSWLDPQFYVPDDSKSKLSSYPYFPGNVIDSFSTTEFMDIANRIARDCVTFQNHLDLRYIVIPTRYYLNLPGDYYDQITSLFAEPFIRNIKDLDIDKDILLTLIVKPFHLEDGEAHEEMLSWATSFPDVSGIYLIIENNFHSKQIKDPNFLSGAMRFIRILRDNELEVHVGYSGLEGLLYSIADPTSVSIGSYENLRTFNVTRLITQEDRQQQGPNPRIYSAQLLQWIENAYLPPMMTLVPNWQQYFDESPYKEYLLNPDSALNFNRSEIYKHYFVQFSRQISELPSLENRAEYISGKVENAINLFEEIKSNGVYFDTDSDESHLLHWLNAISMYRRNSE